MLDTSIVASAFRSRQGASFKLLSAVATGRIVPLATPSLFLEYEDVLKRPEQRAASGLSLTDVDDALRGLAGLIEPVEIRFQWRPQLRDPGDELVLEAAINGRAEALVTYNLRDFLGAAERLNVRVITPKQALQELVL